MGHTRATGGARSETGHRSGPGGARSLCSGAIATVRGTSGNSSEKAWGDGVMATKGHIGEDADGTTAGSKSLAIQLQQFLSGGSGRSGQQSGGGHWAGTHSTG